MMFNEHPGMDIVEARLKSVAAELWIAWCSANHAGRMEMHSVFSEESGV